MRFLNFGALAEVCTLMSVPYSCTWCRPVWLDSKWDAHGCLIQVLMQTKSEWLQTTNNKSLFIHTVIIFTHADESRVSIAFIRVCVWLHVCDVYRCPHDRTKTAATAYRDSPSRVLATYLILGQRSSFSVFSVSSCCAISSCTFVVWILIKYE